MRITKSSYIFRCDCCGDEVELDTVPEKWWEIHASGWRNWKHVCEECVVSFCIFMDMLNIKYDRQMDSIKILSTWQSMKD